MSTKFDWATHSGDAWTRRWREIDSALSDLAPKLHAVLLEKTTAASFRDVGCGAGSTSQQFTHARPDATIVGCDLSPSLVQLAQDRLAGLSSVRILLGDAQHVAGRDGPFDLIFSRHGVMFFEDPVAAFRRIRMAANPGASLVFSCFRDWQCNPWASELASAVADQSLPAPGKEAGGFAFADPAYVRQILESTGWSDCEARPTPFRYVAGRGHRAVEQAMDFLTEVGPASRILLTFSDEEREAAKERMRRVLERYQIGDTVEFPAAAWLWSAKSEPD